MDANTMAEMWWWPLAYNSDGDGDCNGCGSCDQGDSRGTAKATVEATAVAAVTMAMVDITVEAVVNAVVMALTTT